MIIEIETMSKSTEGIEFRGTIPFPERERVAESGISGNDTTEQKDEKLCLYTEGLKKANEEYDVDIRAFNRVHLGSAILVQEK